MNSRIEMKSHPVLFAALLAMPLSFLFASESARAGPEEKAVVAVATDLSERVVTLSESAYVYNWIRPDQLGSETGQDNRPMEVKVRERFAGVAAWFWKNLDTWSSSTTYGLVGIGLYAARDPFSSATYGTVLASIRLDPGAKLLDIRATMPEGSTDTSEFRYGNLIYVRPATVAKLAGVGCDVPTDGYIRDTWLSQPKCSAILAKALRALGVVGNVHSWWGRPVKDCLSKPDAFALFDADYVNAPGRVRVYSAASVASLDKASADESNQEMKTELAAIRALGIENLDASFAEGNVSQLTGSLGISLDAEAAVATPADLKAWKSTRIFHCDEGTDAEKVRLPSWKTSAS